MVDQETLRTVRRLQVQPPINIVGIAKFLGLAVWEDSTLPDSVWELYT
jgi:hypothetical protein